MPLAATFSDDIVEVDECRPGGLRGSRRLLGLVLAVAVLGFVALLAPIMLLTADVVGRVIARPGEVQVGIITALVGAPFFIALVRRRKLAEL